MKKHKKLWIIIGLIVIWNILLQIELVMVIKNQKDIIHEQRTQYQTDSLQNVNLQILYDIYTQQDTIKSQNNTTNTLVSQ